MKTKFLKLTIILLAVALTAQSCGVLGSGNRNRNTVELVWWKTFDEPVQVKPLIEAFQSSFSNIRIRYVEKDVETYEQELLNALAAGTGPDIFTLHNDWLPKHKDKLSPAPKDILNLRTIKEDFVQVVSEDFVEDDEIYALPLALDILAMYYNKDILSSAGIARPPATWEELVNITPRLVIQDSLGNFQRQAVALGTTGNINRAVDILELLMLQNGTQVYSPDRRAATFDQRVRDAQGLSFSPGSRAVEFYTQFANPAKISYTWNSRSNNSIDAFANGQVAMVFSYSYLRDTLSEKAPFLNYGVAAVPQIQGAASRVNFANYWAEGVSKQSQNPEAAWQFLKFITSKQALPEYYAVKNQASPRIDILEQQINDLSIGVFAENALSAKSFFKPDSDAVESILLQLINDVVLRNIAPQEAVSAAAQKINLLLRGR